MTRIPSATYRLQFNRFFTFSQAAGLVEYLHALGITDCYASPLSRARLGSLHGYDVIDHTSLNPELGTWEELQAFAERLQQRGMGLLTDVVPNHMCIADSGNYWWNDVLENGPSSPYARFFDIDWQPLREDLANKVLLPILGDQYGRVLENQEICIDYSGGAFFARVYDILLPVAPRTWRQILEPIRPVLKGVLGESHEHVLELDSILTALHYLPLRTETNEARITERLREMGIIKRRLAALVEAGKEVRQALHDSLQQINGVKGDPRSFNGLETLLAGQAYRLSSWQVAADEINYRRFFDVNDLAAIRVEFPTVFAAVHELVLEMIRRGWVTGLRIDHPDGLFDPDQYFRNLQEACRSAQPAPADESCAARNCPAAAGRPFFLVAEKIVIGDEELRPRWAIH